MSAEGGLTSRVLGTLAEIEAIAGQWRALDDRCADPLGYFQSYDWCRNWVARFCDGEAHTAYVMTIWEGERLVALWPCMVVEAVGMRRLETLGVPHTQYCGLLLDPDTRKRAEIRELFRQARRQSGCDVILSRAVLAGSVLDDMLDADSHISGTDNAASMLELCGFASPEDHFEQLGKLQKRNRNRRRNHLARLGPLDFSVIWPGDPQFADLVARCAAMKRQWLAETGRFSAGFAMAEYEEFLAELEGDRATMTGACLSVLRAGDRVVALELGFLRQGHYYAYIGGFDWDLRQLSPGKVQMDFTVGWLIEQGAKRYDLLINPADYKQSWSNLALPVASYAEPLTWRGRFYATAWLPKVRPVLKRLHQRLPGMADRAIAWLRPAACLILYV